MSYATRTDVEAVFGVENVEKWADIDQNGVAATIATRIANALSYADEKVDDQLRGGPYAIPFTDSPSPVMLVDAAAKLAGVWLYESRGVEDWDPDTGQPHHKLAWHKKTAISWLADVKNGRVRLDITSVDTTHMAVIAHELES